MGDYCPTAFTTITIGAISMINIMKKFKFLALTLILAIVTFPKIAIAQIAIVEQIVGKGKVRIQRENRNYWTPVKQATKLYSGDQILPDKGMKVYLRCLDYSPRILVKAGVPSGLGSICPVWITRRNRGGSRGSSEVPIFLTERRENSTAIKGIILGGIDDTIPYIISPRNSLVLKSEPIIRWNKVYGAREYTVEVISSEGLIWRTNTKDTQIIYAGEPLKRSRPYNIVITTDTGKSSIKDTPANIGFEILGDEINYLQTKLAQIPTNDLSIEVYAMTLSHFYRDYVDSVLPTIDEEFLKGVFNFYYNLNSEAIPVLEHLVQQGKKSPLIYRNIGDLYIKIGVFRIAENYYLKTINLSKNPEDLEDKTLAHHNLGWMYEEINDFEKSLNHYKQAKDGYTLLGDFDMTKKIQTDIEELKKAETQSVY